MNKREMRAHLPFCLPRPRRIDDTIILYRIGHEIECYLMTTAYVTDTRFDAHTLAGHVEVAERLAAIRDVMAAQALPQRMSTLTPVEATYDQLCAVHTSEYLELLTWTETQRGLMLGPDTYVLPQSFAIARLSAGAAISGVDAVLGGKADNALVCARPP